MHTLCKLAGLLLLCAGLLGATGLTSEYITSKQTTLSGAAEVITIQAPAGVGKYVTFKAAQVWCSTGTLDVTIERDGTAASTTSLAIAKINPNATWVPSSSLAAFHTSNVGSGTQVGLPQTVVCGTSGVVLDMESFVFERGSSAVRNLTIRTASYTGTVRIAIKWEERLNP